VSTGALCTIVSGLPGTGKTALMVDMILTFLEKEPDRPLFAMGVTDLKLPHHQVPPVSEWTVMEPHPDDPSIDFPVFTFPVGSIVIIDEAQNIFRPRPTGSKVPPHVAAMERHRHKGIDFVLGTQFPTMLDAQLRVLAGKHLHLRSLWSGGQMLEWSEVADPKSISDRSRAAVTRYSPPKRTFGLYKSSSMHVKRTRRLPKMVYVLGAVVVIGAALGYKMYARISGAINGEPTAGAVAASPYAQAGQGGGSSVPPGHAASAIAQAKIVGGEVSEYVPRIATRPETAPLYDGLRQVKSLPVVAGCAAMRDRCTCYTDQGTDAFLTGDQCREWLRVPAFNPYRDPAALVHASSGGRGDSATPLPNGATPSPRSGDGVIRDGGTYAGVPALGS